MYSLELNSKRLLILFQLLNRELVMENGFLDKVEDNVALFYREYGVLPYLLDVKVDKHLFRALAQYWNPAYSYFTFKKSRQRPDFLIKANEHNWDERAMGFDLGTSEYEEKVRRLRLEYLRVGHLPQRVVGYVTLLVLRQYRLRQFILVMQGSLELGKTIEKLEEEKIQPGLDVDVQKLEAEKMRKGINKVEEDLDSLKRDYKKLGLSIKTVRFGKTSESWRRNSVIELKVSLNKIEELKGKIEELEAVLDRDHIVGEALTQVQEVTENLQTLAVQADMLSLRYESESDQSQELAWLLRRGNAIYVKYIHFM
ncbi:hypothetical protein Goshw_000053 [Gossypium schwendimanii]|uniref:Uncharacterized protein n=1 Tax=Gossypium schwendimanii TaxID=34291 RepID=A0A7J9LZJ0_GOSSC|nr:hypothetical protein [Gossypium schwendimanii]